MTGIKGRISLLADILEVKKVDFFRRIGVAPSGYRGTAISGEVTSDVIVKILTEFPEIRSEWLLLGQGEALRRGDASISVANDNKGTLIIGDSNSGVRGTDANEEISMLRQLLYNKDEQIRRLTDMLSKAQDTIHALSTGQIGS